MALGKRCVFVTLEMPKPQILRRAWQSITGSPKIDTTVRLPYFAPDKELMEDITEDTKWRVEYKDMKKSAVNLDDVEAMQNRIKRMFRGGDCRFIPMPAKATTVKDVETVLDNLRFYNDYDTDVLIIDYADLMGAKTNEYRHQLDDIWSNLKRVAQERGILVITATQTNRGGLDGSDIEVTNVAEDMRKLAHVSKFIALNQTIDEKVGQIIRWRMLLDRDEQSVYDDAYTVQCLQIGKFALDSRLKGDMILCT
jgi:replicative DNA helicase